MPPTPPYSGRVGGVCPGTGPADRPQPDPALEEPMGYAYYTVTRHDGIEIEAGYAVEAVCEQDGCTEQIDRGLDQLCGSEPGAPEDGCGGYFCSRHLYYPDWESEEPQPLNCKPCVENRD
ncbi:hypothetical protein [Kitasatospora sp. HPMI-4]|uniref:hypothetical protein n=1 Tax=Kitasatospora sp. HPMI-4 TaxID=3448443 RepID=UPI003F1D3D3B